MFSSTTTRLLLRRLPTTSTLLQTASKSRISNSQQLIRSNTRVANNLPTRLLSTTPQPPSQQQQPIANANIPPPTSLTPEAGLGAQDAMKLFIQHGVGRRKLDQIAASKTTNNTPLVDRWQTMVATYIETQCHVITLLGYTPDERGIGLYTQHLQQALSSSSPEVQEMLRVAGRDTYRMVLAYAFDLPSLMEEQGEREELTVVEARNIMHKVSLRMQSPDVLEKVSKICSSSIVHVEEGNMEAQQLDMARKHTVIQQVMVDDVYLASGDNGSSESLVSECGFGEGEEGYVRLQFQLAEHQGDPLISQYVGAAMMKLMEAAGIDLAAFQQQAQGQA